VFRESGLDPRRWDSPDARFSDERLDRAWLRAAELTGDPCLGLRAARFINPGSLHALGFAWLVSDTLYDALTRLVRYFEVISNGVGLELSVSGDECRLTMDRILLGRSALAYRLDAAWAALIAMCRLNLSDDYAPLSLTLSRPAPPCTADFYRLFGCPVTFAAPCDAMTFARASVEQPLPTANRVLARTNEQVIADYLARFHANSFPDRVRTRLIELLPGGTYNEETVAQSLNVSRRTLQRRLADDGTSFKVLLDEARRELAVRYIGEKRLSIKETSYLLGFGEPGNFTRAFKRWTGEPPSRFRAGTAR